MTDNEALEDQLRQTFGEQHMQPMIEECDYWEVDTDNGLQIIPADVVGFNGAKIGDEFPIDEEDDKGANHALANALTDFCEGELLSATLKHGWIARLSAPGYMDSTDWSAFDSFAEAADYLIDTYGDET